jgi:hypothetical protein
MLARMFRADIDIVVLVGRAECKPETHTWRAETLRHGMCDVATSPPRTRARTRRKPRQYIFLPGFRWV